MFSLNFDVFGLKKNKFWDWGRSLNIEVELDDLDFEVGLGGFDFKFELFDLDFEFYSLVISKYKMDFWFFCCFWCYSFNGYYFFVC